MEILIETLGSYSLRFHHHHHTLGRLIGPGASRSVCAGRGVRLEVEKYESKHIAYGLAASGPG